MWSLRPVVTRAGAVAFAALLGLASAATLLVPAASADGTPSLLVDVERDGLAPKSVTVSVPYVVEVDPVTPWRGESRLLTVEVVPGTSPRVRATASFPEPLGERTWEFAGVLLLTGVGTPEATVKVMEGTTVVFSARLHTSGANPRVEIAARDPTTGQTHEHVLAPDHALLGGGRGGFVVGSAMRALRGLPREAEPVRDALSPVFTLVERADGAWRAIVGDVERDLGRGAPSGSPFGSGLVVREADGREAFTLRVTPPATPGAPLEARLSGPRVAPLAQTLAGSDDPAIDSITVRVVPPPVLPAGFVEIVEGAADETEAAAMQLLDPATLAPVVSLARNASGELVATVPATGDRIEIAEGPATLTTDPSGLGVRVRDENGDLLTLTVDATDPAKARLRGPAGIDFTANAILGVVTVKVEEAGRLVEAVIVDGNTGPLASFVTGSAPAGGTAPASIDFEGDPASPAGFALVARDGGGVTLAKAHVAPPPVASGNRVLGSGVVTLTGAAFPSGPRTVMSPLEIEGDASGSFTRVRLLSPFDAGASMLTLARGSDGRITLATPAGSWTIEGPAVLRLSPAPATSDVVTAQAVGADGTVLLTLNVDRRETPWKATVSGPVDLLVYGPLTLAGPLESPTAIGVANPATGATIFRYARAPDGTATVQLADAEERISARLVSLEGNPARLEPFTISVRDGDGAVRHAYTFNPPTLAASMLGAQAEPEPVFAATGEPSRPVRYVSAVMDETGSKRIPRAQLDGDAYLTGSARHWILAESPLSDGQYARAFAVINGVERPLARLDDVDGHARWAGLFDPGTLPDGDLVSFKAVFERDLAPFMVARFPDEHGGSGYRYRIDRTGPVAVVHAPAAPDKSRFTVDWSATDALSGVDTYQVQVRVGNAAWATWIDASRQTSGSFAGAAGNTYGFRVRAVDKAGIVGPYSPIATTHLATQATDPTEPENRAPTVRILAPSAGDLLQGVTTIRWLATDPDGDTPAVNAYLSKDGGATWRAIHSASEASTWDWDTRGVEDGTDYRIKLAVTDGTLADADVTGRFTIRNLAAEPGLPPPFIGPKPAKPGEPSQQPGPSDPAAPRDREAPPPEPAKGIPGPGFALVALGLLAAVAFARRR